MGGNHNRTMKPATNTISLQNFKRGTIPSPGVNGQDCDNLIDDGRGTQNFSRKILSSTNNQNLKSVNKDLKQSISMSGT